MSNEKALSKNILGKTGMEVTEFCLGVLPMGPLQADLPPSSCVELIDCALEQGVNFLDTAETYATQPYVGEALGEKRSQVVISTKSMAFTYDEMARSVEKSLREMKTDYIDIYNLHAHRLSPELFTDKSGALQYLREMKEQKVIRAIGVATHNVEVVNEAAERDDIDIIFPIVNKKGQGIVGGTLPGMLHAVSRAHQKGKGLLAMKALAGGNLLPEIADAFRWTRGLKEFSSIAVGVVSREELLMDLRFFGQVDPPAQESIVTKAKRVLILEKQCRGCGACLKACPNEALYMEGDKARVEQQKCLLCGYCNPECPEFAIRVV